MSRHPCRLSVLPYRFCLAKFIDLQSPTLILWSLAIWVIWEPAVQAVPLISLPEDASNDEGLISNDADSVVEGGSLKHIGAESTYSFTALSALAPPLDVEQSKSVESQSAQAEPDADLHSLISVEQTEPDADLRSLTSIESQSTQAEPDTDLHSSISVEQTASDGDSHLFPSAENQSIQTESETASYSLRSAEQAERGLHSSMSLDEQSVQTKPAIDAHFALKNQNSEPTQPTSIANFLQQNSKRQTKAAALLLPAHSTHQQTQFNFNQTEQRIAAAGPENFNPSLLQPNLPLLNLPSPPLPPSSPIPPLNQPEPDQPEPPIFDLEPAPFVSFEDLQVDFRNSRDNFGQQNRFIEPTLQFRFGEEPALFQLKTGFNTFEQRDVETVTNIPIQLGLQTKIGDKKVQIAAGVDVFNRLPTAFNLSAQITIPVTNKITVFGVLEHGPYKANAETLQNQITAWRFGPNIYWQIDRHTSFFSSLRIGLYNDGNREQQSFSRLERRFGQFYVAANVFNWIFSDDVQEESGYFSPPDFLVYNGEIGWEGKPFDFLRCRVNTNLGRQRLNGKVTKGNTYQARCTARLSRRVELDFGYAFTNVANRDAGDRVYANQTLLGLLRVNF